MQMNAHMPKKSVELRDWPLVAWWIRITSPDPDSPAGRRNPQWREEVTSLLFPVVILPVVLSIPTAFTNPPILIILLTVLCIDVGAVFLKRAGNMRLAGIIITITVEFGLCSAVLSPGHIDIQSMSVFDLLVQSIIVTMAFFPPLTVFLICLVNCSFILATLRFFPHGAALNQYLPQNLMTLGLSPILLQIYVAGVSFIIIRALMKEIMRANNAEELAEVKQSEAELRKREAEQARQIEEGIQLILQALNTAAAKGDFSMRVPLAQENILWRVGYSINNLLARLQGFKHERAELDKTRVVAEQLTACIRQATPFPLNQWTGTSLDQLIIELNKHLLARSTDQPPLHASFHRTS